MCLRHSSSPLDSVAWFRTDTTVVAECCCPPLEAIARKRCPSCDTASVRVEVATVKALLLPSALSRLPFAGKFHFCASLACPVVYFTDADAPFFTTDVRVPVWQKAVAGARTICYCFGENETDMKREIEESGRTQALERVRVHIAGRRCACEVRNPRGACCLGDLAAAVKSLSPIQQEPV